MAFVPITTAEITSGEPVSNATQTKIKDNFDDHEARLGTVEAASNLFAPTTFDFVGTTGQSIVVDGLMFWRIPFNITILGARLMVFTAGASGSLEIDFQLDSGSGFGTILSSTISVPQSSGDFTLGSGTLVVTEADAGDILRIDVNAVQVDGKDWSGLFEFEAR